jgi:hypothetical protein
MSESNRTPTTPRDAESWARPLDKLSVGNVPGQAINLNVDGRRLTGPLNGFGQMWQKTYKVRLPGAGIKPQEIITRWKANFPNYWPDGNYFYGNIGSIEPGDVAVLNLAGPAGTSVSTGIRVIFADDESFSFMTPEGHMFAAMITFSAFAEGEDVWVQIQALVRASDPIYEIGCRIGLVHKMEDQFWHGTLKNLAADFGVEATAEQKTVLVDKKVLWSGAKNVWHNSAIRTGVYLPVHLTKRLLRRA